jgi:hypothetical protein
MAMDHLRLYERLIRATKTREIEPDLEGINKAVLGIEFGGNGTPGKDATYPAFSSNE